MATTEKLMTAEGLFQMPEPEDGSRCELIRGELITMPPANPRHGRCCLRIGAKLMAYADERRLGFVACNDPGVITERDPDTVRGVDVAFWSKQRLPSLPNHYTDVVPDLAAEVVSPSDTHARVLEKVVHYLEHGVRMVWVVDPEDRIATVYRSLKDGRILRESEEIDGGDVLPGFTCRVGEFFE